MSRGYVFDTEGIIAFLYNEPGHEAVDDVPTDASLREADRDRDIRALERQGLELEAADWRLAAEVKADGSISLANACAVALAHLCTRR